MLRYSPDGKLLATGDAFGIVRVWDTATIQGGCHFQGPRYPDSARLAFRPDGQWLYSASQDGLVRRWKIASEPDPDTVDGDAPSIRSSSASPATARVYLSFRGSKPGLLRRWTSGSGISRVGGSWLDSRRRDSVATNLMVISPDGSFVVYGKAGDRSVTLWDVMHNREVGKLPTESWTRDKAHFSPDARTVVLADSRGLTLWNTETAKPQSRIDQPSVGALPSPRTAASWPRQPRRKAEMRWCFGSQRRSRKRPGFRDGRLT